MVPRDVVIAWWTLTTLLSFSAATCPQTCSCRHNDMIVDCSGRQLRALPGGLQPNITKLRLSNNNFVTLAPSMFSNYPSLHHLDLSRNRIVDVSALALNQLSSLSHLNLSENVITSLYPDTFRDLQRATVIDLSGNRFETLPVGLFRRCSELATLLLGNNRLTSEVFWVVRSVTWLQYLNLSYNWLVQLPYAMLADMSSLQILSMTHAHIRHIDPNAFVGMRSLQFLYLSANQLEAISPEMFQPLDMLSQLDIADNHIKCACSTKRFQDWLETSYVLLTRPVSCTTTDGAPVSVDKYSDLSFLCDEKGQDFTTPKPVTFTVPTTTAARTTTTTTTTTTIATTTVVPPTTTREVPVTTPVRRYEQCGAINSEVSVQLHSCTDRTALVGWTASGLLPSARIIVTCYGFGDDVRHVTKPFPSAMKQATVVGLRESTTYMACVTVERCTRLVSCTHFTTSSRVAVTTSGPTADASMASWSRMLVIGAALALAVLLLIIFVVICLLLACRRRRRRHKRPVTVVTSGSACGASSRMRLNSLQRAVEHGVIVGDNQYESIPVDGRSLQRLHKFAPFDNGTYAATCACGMAAKYGVPCDCGIPSQEASIYDGDGYLEPVSIAIHPRPGSNSPGPRRFTKPGCEDASTATDALLTPSLKAQLARSIADREQRANQARLAGPSRHYKNVSPHPPRLPPRDLPLNRPTSPPLSPHLYSAVDESAMS